MSKKSILFFFLIFLSGRSFAWDFKDFSQEAASPYTTNARTALYIGAGLTAAAIIFEDKLDKGQDEVVEDKPLGNFSKYGDWAGQMVPNILYIGGQSIAAYYGDGKGYDRALGMFKASAYSTGVTTALKYTVREPRPNDHSTRNSFPSGHSTTAFAFAGFVASEHGWVWGGAATLMATFVGISRINDNMHRTQDVLAGATIGWVYGWGMSQLQKKHKEEPTVSFVPILDSQAKGLALYSEF